MKVILLKDLRPTGKAGDLIEVNDGYARNFLLPNKIAEVATKDAQNARLMRLEREELLRAEREKAAAELRRRLSGATVRIRVKCCEGRMYGSVTAAELCRELNAQGFETEKKNVRVLAPIRKTGTYEAEVRCGADAVAKIRVEVVDENEKRD